MSADTVGDDLYSDNPKPRALHVRLIAMMLLEFFVPGTFVATMGLVLATNDLSSIIGFSYTLAAVAAIVSPMFLGALGDRLLQTQHVLGLSHIVGGVLLLFIPAAVHAGNALVVLLLIFVYKIFYQPTVGLSNAIAFRHLGRGSRMFPYIRVFGTLGWVLAGLTIGWMGLSASTGAFLVTAIGSFVIGVYAFTLPATRPEGIAKRFSWADLVGARAFVLLRQRSFLVFMICAVLTSISLGTYNSYASPYLGALGIENVAGVLSIGQMSEVIFILTIPFVLKRFGMKYTLLCGMALWAVRFLLLGVAASTENWVAVVAVGLHGICNDFFIIVGAMFIDRVAPRELQAQAQSMLILVIQGIGASIGSLVAGTIYNATIGGNPQAAAADWWPVWIFPIAAAVITTALWTMFFHQRGVPEGGRAC
ncbi:MFS transporter [Brachybacterium kimchii]|uniref:MFS transporter n=1 Tax=Brachybacterium kimchii TaxID=2942909 RepID=A0ABY4N7B0_9MICO|nr:MFS transporter [Brachybacterium kimchii]UQN30448.1 MFS transporter [Brachybacterium kimchii]